jgi:hypothetical protein
MLDGALDCAQAASSTAVREMQAHHRDSMSIFYLFLVPLRSLAILVNIHRESQSIRNDLFFIKKKASSSVCHRNRWPPVINTIFATWWAKMFLQMFPLEKVALGFDSSADIGRAPLVVSTISPTSKSSAANPTAARTAEYPQFSRCGSLTKFSNVMHIHFGTTVLLAAMIARPRLNHPMMPEMLQPGLNKDGVHMHTCFEQRGQLL